MTTQVISGVLEFSFCICTFTYSRNGYRYMQHDDVDDWYHSGNVMYINKRDRWKDVMASSLLQVLCREAGKHCKILIIQYRDPFLRIISISTDSEYVEFLRYNRKVQRFRGCIQKFPDWVDNEINNNNKKHVEKQHKGLWRQNSRDWLTK
jgi:hypothetical protein